MRVVCHFIIIREKYFKDDSDETDDELDVTLTVTTSGSQGIGM